MKYLDGRRLADWLDPYVPEGMRHNMDAFKHWLLRCQHGQVTKVWTADRYLIELGLSVQEIPDECWVEKAPQAR